MIKKSLEKHVFNIFLLGIVSALLPPAFIPGASFLYLPYLGRLLLLMAFLGYLYLRVRFDEDVKGSLSISFLLLLLLFLIVSLSSLYAINVLAFTKAYEKFVLGMIVYVVVRFFVDGSKGVVVKVYQLLLGVALVRLVMELFMVFLPELFTAIGEQIFKPLMMQSIKANFARNRSYVDFIQEASVPILLFGLLDKNNSNRKKLFFSLLIVIMGGLAFISNWRGRILVFGFSLLSFILLNLFYGNRSKKKINTTFIIGSVFGIILLFGFLDRFSLEKSGFSVVDRLLNKDYVEDIATVDWRINVFIDSVGMGRSSLFGVGLGNFYEWTNYKIRHTFVVREYGDLADAAILHGPHNVFFQYIAEVGYIAFLVFVIYLGYVFIKDVRKVMSQSYSIYKKSLIFSFWSLVAVVQFYPATSLSYYVMFYLLRGLVDDSG